MTNIWGFHDCHFLRLDILLRFAVKLLVVGASVVNKATLERFRVVEGVVEEFAPVGI